MGIINLDPEQVPNQDAQDNILGDVQLQETKPEVQEQETNPKEQTIVMDGPLSKIYTQALNLVYSNEAASASGAGITDVKLVFDENIEELNEEDGKSLYVYCCDADELTNDEVIKSSDKLRLALDSKRYKDTLLVMESHGHVSPSAGLLEEYAYKSGCKVVFSKPIALETIDKILSYQLSQ